MPFFGKTKADDSGNELGADEWPDRMMDRFLGQKPKSPEDDGGYGDGRGYDSNFHRDWDEAGKRKDGSWFDVVPGEDGTWTLQFNKVDDNGEWFTSAPAGGFETEDDAWGWLFRKGDDLNRHKKRIMGRYYNSGLDWTKLQHPTLRGER